MFKKISITFLSKVINSVLGLLNTILIAQFLGAQGKGETTLFMTSITLCLLFCQIIGGNSMVYLSSRISPSSLLIGSYAWSVVVASVTSVSLFVTGVCPPEYVIELVVVSILFALFHTHLFILLGNKKEILFNILTPIPQLLQLLASLLLFYVFLIDNVQLYIHNLYLVFTISYIISLLFILPKLGEIKMPSVEILKTLFRYGSNAQLSNILFFFNNRIFFYVLGYYFIKTEIGIYSIGVIIIEAILLIGNSISLMLYAKIANRNSNAYQIALTKKFIALSVGITFIAVVCAGCIPTEVFLYIFGAEFGSSKLVLLYLLPGTLMMSMYYVTSSYFSGVGKYQYNNYAVSLGLLITLVGGALFIPSGDILAAAIVTSIAFIAIAGCSLIQFYTICIHTKTEPV